jgi:hypothetical protein
MDWLAAGQDQIGQGLARRCLLDPGANPRKMALFDLTSAWVEGRCDEYAGFGYSRDKKKHRRQIEFALVAAPDGAPVAIRAFKGNTADPTAFAQAIVAVADQFGITDAVLVGDRGMITDARVRDLKARPGLGWITALRHAQVAQLAAESGGGFQPSLLDDWGLAEFRSPAYPGERLVACRNPDVADRSRIKRGCLVQASLDALAPVVHAVDAGRLKDPAIIGRRVGKLIGKYKVEKHLAVQIGPGRIAAGPDNGAIRRAEALDGLYIVRTSLDAGRLDAPDVVRAYKDLSHVEQDFSWIKGDDIQVRPIWRRKARRVEGHLLICLLACHLAWRLKKAWAPLTYADTIPKPAGQDPVKAQRRFGAAAAKASARRLPEGGRPRTFRGLLDHLGLLQRVSIDVTVSGKTHTLTRVNQPTPDQAEAFRLLGVPIPDTLTGNPHPGRHRTR